VGGGGGVGEFAGDVDAPGAGVFSPVVGGDITEESDLDESSDPGPVYVPGEVPYPAPDAGIGKSSHSSQWNRDQCEKEHPITLVPSAIASTTFRSLTIFEVLFEPDPARPAMAALRPFACCILQLDRSQRRVIRVDPSSGSAAPTATNFHWFHRPSLPRTMSRICRRARCCGDV
jgi:hypothetical protein